MIKREWVNERNGFKVGERVLLYYPNQSVNKSIFRVFSLLSLGENWELTSETPLIFKHGQDVIYGDQGHLFPIESQEYRAWNPFTKVLEINDPIRYYWAVISPGGLNIRYSDLLPDRGFSPICDTILRRPDWAVRFS